MADWEKLRELTHEVPTPDFESLERTARGRQRRARAAAGVVGALVLVGAGLGIGTIDLGNGGDPAPAEDPTGSLTDEPDLVQALPEPDGGEEAVALDAGRYRVPLDESLSFDVDVPDQTYAHDDGLFLASGPVVLKTELAGETYGVPADPCDDQRIVSVGPTVADLVEAIRDRPIYAVDHVRPVRLGGAEGTYLEVRIRSDHVTGFCADGVALPGTPTTSIGSSPGYHGYWWILDVDGQRVVVQQNCACGTGVIDRAAAIPRSITFRPTS
jgi:hypothetical protein